MSLLPALGSRQYPASTASTTRQTETSQSGNAAGSAGSAASTLMNRTQRDAVSLSQNGIDLSAQGMAARAGELGDTTIGVAQDFMASFAQQLFGDAAKGATISFDSASLSAESSFAGLVQHSQGARGTTDGAAFSLNESSHFIGKGKITTADGQSFEFEIEVQYESRIEAAATRTQSGATDAAGTGARTDSDASDSAALPTLQLPDIAFPGGLSDLFKMLGRPLQSDVLANQDGATGATTDQASDPVGKLTLRLLNLINNPTKLDGALDATPEQSEAAARAKALANAYGTPAPAAEANAPAAPVTPDAPSAAAA